jgi:DNA-binding NarL/FixJ family response regulator
MTTPMTEAMKSQRLTLDQRVRAVVERATGRRVDTTVRVRHIEPWSLKEKPEPSTSDVKRRRTRGATTGARDKARQRREEVARLDDEGRSRAEIAVELGVSTAVIGYDLRTLGRLRLSPEEEERMRRVADLAKEGLNTKQIARRLGLGYHTVGRDMRLLKVRKNPNKKGSA